MSTESLQFYLFMPTIAKYSKTCVKRPLPKRPKIGLTATLKKTQNWFSRPVIA